MHFNVSQLCPMGLGGGGNSLQTMGMLLFYSAIDSQIQLWHDEVDHCHHEYSVCRKCQIFKIRNNNFIRYSILMSSFTATVTHPPSKGTYFRMLLCAFIMPWDPHTRVRSSAVRNGNRPLSDKCILLQDLWLISCAITLHYLRRSCFRNTVSGERFIDLCQRLIDLCHCAQQREPKSVWTLDEQFRNFGESVCGVPRMN